MRVIDRNSQPPLLDAVPSVQTSHEAFLPFILTNPRLCRLALFLLPLDFLGIGLSTDSPPPFAESGASEASSGMLGRASMAV